MTIARTRLAAAALALGLALLPSCTSTNSGCRADQHWRTVASQEGKATWYSIRTNRGTRTASGRPLCDHQMTAAHRHLPFGSHVRVTNIHNQKSTTVVITDRGPFIRGRIIDLSLAAAREVDMIQRGVIPVKIEVLAPANPGRPEA
jgi:rare lipoprotein A